MTRPRSETRTVRIGALLMVAGTFVALCAPGLWMLAGFVALCVGAVLVFRAGIVSGRWEA